MYIINIKQKTLESKKKYFIFKFSSRIVYERGNDRKKNGKGKKHKVSSFDML